MEMPAPSFPLSRRRVIAGGLAVGAVPLLPRFLGAANAAPRAFGFPEPDMTSRIVRPMEFPVEGEVNWSDTYGACRDGCTRRHEGQDLLGRKLQKLVACVDGTVVGLKFSSSGNSLYLRDAEGWHYGYLHINNDTPGTDDGLNPRTWAFAPGIDVGTPVRKGQFIAYMGDSGNAESTVPHCHYEIRKPADAWYRAQAINAAYSLNAASHSGVSGVPASTFTPWVTATAFVSQQYQDFLDRRPTSAESAVWTTRLDDGGKTPADLIEWIIQEPGSGDTVAPLIRMYWAFFNRVPDTQGLMYWIRRVRSGSTLDEIAYVFSLSSEFRRRYGSLDDGRYVDQVYKNILGKTPDPAGRAYWLRRLGSGTSRSRMIRYLAETDHFRFVTVVNVRTCLVYAGMLQRAPDASGYRYWRDRISERGMPLQTMISTIQGSASYRARFPDAAKSSMNALQANAPQAKTPLSDGATNPGPATAPPGTTAPPATAPAPTSPPTTSGPPPTTGTPPTTAAPPTTGAPPTTAPSSTTIPRVTTTTSSVPLSSTTSTTFVPSTTTTVVP